MRHTRFAEADLDQDPRLNPLTRDAYRWLWRLANDRVDPEEEALWSDWRRIEDHLLAMAPALRHLDAHDLAVLGFQGVDLHLQRRHNLALDLSSQLADGLVDVVHAQGWPRVHAYAQVDSTAMGVGEGHHVAQDGEQPPPLARHALVECLDDSRIYLRLESDTVQAVRDEIVRLVRRALVERGELVEPATAAGAAPAEGPKSRGRSRRGGNGKPASTEPAPAPALPVQDEILSEEPFPVQSEHESSLRPPKVGVQIVDVRERGGVRYYTIRDLRNGSSVQNVTLKSARRLWRYAISQHEQAAPKASAIQWAGDVGLVRAEKRAGKQRYDFAQRLPDGSIAIYYGVTEEGCDDPWRQFLVGQDLDDGAEAPASDNADAD
jgi:hypothetical protein